MVVGIDEKIEVLAQLLVIFVMVAAARLSSVEAMALLQELATGRIMIAKPKPRSILIAPASDF